MSVLKMYNNPKSVGYYTVQVWVVNPIECLNKKKMGLFTFDIRRFALLFIGVKKTIHMAEKDSETESLQNNDDDLATLNLASPIHDYDEEEEEITAQKVLEFLESAWINELCAPEILPHQSDMLELMMGQVAHMEENMKDLDKNDFRFVVHQMELERIRYIMGSYLRRRLQKIEAYSKHILNDESIREPDEKRLAPEELKFAQEYDENVEEHFQQIALQYMPNMQRSEADQRVVRPNLMSHVFIKANVSVPAVVVGVDDEEVDLAAGSQHIIPYQLIADLVQKNQLQLI